MGLRRLAVLITAVLGALFSCDGHLFTLCNPCRPMQRRLPQVPTTGQAASCDQNPPVLHIPSLHNLCWTDVPIFVQNALNHHRGLQKLGDKLLRDISPQLRLDLPCNNRLCNLDNR